MSALLPCPFCGNAEAPALAHIDGNAVVACYGAKGGCGAHGEAIDSQSPFCEEAAIEAWNRRSATPEKSTGQ